jgi:hypothetical protein
MRSRRSRANDLAVGQQAETSARTMSNVNFNAVLAQHLDRFCDIWRPGWNLTIQCGEHRNRITSFSSDFQHFSAPRANAKSVNNTSRKMNERTCRATPL